LTALDRSLEVGIRKVRDVDGSFKEVDFTWPELADGDFDRQIKAAGCEEFSDWGESGGDELALWRLREGQDRPAYVLELNTYRDCAHVFAADLPRALELVARWLRIVQTARVFTFLDNLETAIARAFEAWHGHEPFNGYCANCDAPQVERVRQARLRRPARNLTKDAV
jgi:hypothetical protein